MYFLKTLFILVLIVGFYSCKTKRENYIQYYGEVKIQENRITVLLSKKKNKGNLYLEVFNNKGSLITTEKYVFLTESDTLNLSNEFEDNLQKLLLKRTKEDDIFLYLLSKKNTSLFLQHIDEVLLKRNSR